jgi:hypothetical protein
MPAGSLVLHGRRKMFGKMMKLVKPSDASAAAISHADDERNMRLIAHGSLASAVWSAIAKTKRPLNLEQARLIQNGTPQERQAYVRRQAKLSWTIMLGIGLAVAWIALQPRQAKLLPRVEITDAGTIKSIQLHETSLSTATTVTTTAGVYQVRGGVSVATDDKAMIESKEVGALGVQKSLCIQSSIKTDCYPLI